jgi:hypothetical protein
MMVQQRKETARAWCRESLLLRVPRMPKPGRRAVAAQNPLYEEKAVRR